MNNKELIAEFNKWLGSRFKEISEASVGAPITCMCVDQEDKEYYIKINYNPGVSSKTIEKTGIKIENTDFYQLYAMVSQNLNVFHFECFNDGFGLWYLNELTPEQIKVSDNYTLVGIASVLHYHTEPVVISSLDPKSKSSYTLIK